MSKFVWQLVITIAFGVNCMAQHGDSIRNAGNASLAEAEKELAANSDADVASLVREGWSAVKMAGEPRFLEGVERVTRLLFRLGHDREVDSVYDEAIFLCERRGLTESVAALSYMRASSLAGRFDFVRAGKLLQANVAREDKSGKPTSYYLYSLQLLARVLQEQGETEAAEHTLRSLVAKAESGEWMKLRAQPRPAVLPLPMLEESHYLLAQFFQAQQRFTEAEQLYRGQVERTQGDRDKHMEALGRLSAFLAFRGSWQEAEKTQRALVELKAQALRGEPQAGLYDNDESKLASYQLRAGHEEDARKSLQGALADAAARHGRMSQEYAIARNRLIENLLEAKDFAGAEKLAREWLADAEGFGPPEALVPAMERLYQALQGKGEVSAAEEVGKRIGTIRRKTDRSLDLRIRYENVQRLARAGEMSAALAELDAIVNTYAPLRTGEMASFPEAVEAVLGSRDLASGNKEEGLKAVELGLGLVERAQAGDRPGVARLLARYAFLQGFFLHDAETGNALMARAEHIIQECCGEQSPRMEYLLCQQFYKGRAERIAGLEKLRRFQSSVFGPQSNSVESTTLQLGNELLQAGRWNEARPVFTELLTISARRDGQASYRHLELMNLAADGYFRAKHVAEALALNNEALELAQKSQTTGLLPHLQQQNQMMKEALAQEIAK